MWIRFDIAQRVFVTAGKQHVRWGTGRFWQPTDYLHLLKRNPLDVFDARQGTSMLKLHVPWEATGVELLRRSASSRIRTWPPTTCGRLAGGGARRDRHRRRRDRPGRVSSSAIRSRASASTSRPASGTSTSTPTSPSARARTSTSSTRSPGHDRRCAPTRHRPACRSIRPTICRRTTASRPLSGIKTQAVGGVNWSRKYNDNDLFTIGAEYFYNQPGLRGPVALSRPAVQQRRHADAELLLHRAGTTRRCSRRCRRPTRGTTRPSRCRRSANLSDLSFVSRARLLGHGADPPDARGVRRRPLRLREAGEFRLGFDILRADRHVNPTMPAICVPIPAASLQARSCSTSASRCA